MQATIRTILASRRNPWLIPAALLLGIGLGLFVSGYWLSDLLPASSKQLLAFTMLVALVGAVGYWLMLGWIGEQLASLRTRARFAMLVLSLVGGSLLLFGGTGQWLAPGHYISILLPTHHLRIVASGQQQPQSIALKWFTSSLGDTSYDSMTLQGWKRSGDQLVLVDPQANAIQWAGRTGESSQLIFQSSSAAGQLSVTWDGRFEIIRAAPGKLPYSKAFPVPWYASRWLVLGLGILVFGSLCLALGLRIWERRAAYANIVLRSVDSGSQHWDRRDTLILLSSLLLALLLRLPNLGVAYPAVDEYTQLIAARQIAEGAATGSVYARGLWLVTIPVSLALRLFGFHLWAARLVGVLVNVLAIWPLFLLARRINRPVAVLSVVLFATSPWIITFARVTREYAYYPFFFYWIVLGMIVFLRSIPQRFVPLQDWRKIFAPQMTLLAAALVLPLLFALFVDPLSTFRAILIAYLVFGIFVLAKFNFSDRSNQVVLGLLLVVALAAGYLLYQRDVGRLVAIPRFNPVPIQYFLPNPAQQWYFGRMGVIVVLALLAALASSILARRVNAIPFFLLGLFIAYAGFFAFFSKTFFHTRHLSTTELWYIVLVACGGYSLWLLLKSMWPWKSNRVRVIVGLALAVCVFNTGQVVSPLSASSANDPISEDYLHDMSQIQSFMTTHAQPGDVLISTVYGLYSAWTRQPTFAASYRITTDTSAARVLRLVGEYDTGWIVIDQIRLEMSGLDLHAFAGNSDVKYIGLFGDQQVWHWQHAPVTIGSWMAAEKAQ